MRAIPLGESEAEPPAGGAVPSCRTPSAPTRSAPTRRHSCRVGSRRTASRDDLSGLGELSLYGLRRGTAGHGPCAKRGLHGDGLVDVLLDQRRQLPELVQGHATEFLSMRDAV